MKYAVYIVFILFLICVCFYNKTYIILLASLFILTLNFNKRIITGGMEKKLTKKESTKMDYVKKYKKYTQMLKKK